MTLRFFTSIFSKRHTLSQAPKVFPCPIHQRPSYQPWSSHGSESRARGFSPTIKEQGGFTESTVTQWTKRAFRATRSGVLNLSQRFQGTMKVGSKTLRDNDGSPAIMHLEPGFTRFMEESFTWMKDTAGQSITTPYYATRSRIAKVTQRIQETVKLNTRTVHIVSHNEKLKHQPANMQSIGDKNSTTLF